VHERGLVERRRAVVLEVRRDALRAGEVEPGDDVNDATERFAAKSRVNEKNARDEKRMWRSS